MAWITVIDVMRDLGLEPSNGAAWEIGAAVRVAWETENGELPRNELRRKTAGGGSHCLAVYPPGWRPRIEQIVRRFVTTRALQPDLFHHEGGAP